MKKSLLIIVLLSGLLSFGQHDKEKRTEPNPQIQAKQLTLALDLSNKQETQVLKVLEQNHQKMKALKPEKGTMKEMSVEQRDAQRIKILNQRIAFQREMKSVLNADQYVEWREQMQKLKRAKRAQLRRERQS
jgi:parvulin-like peptidyl-prolyl isomerase